jgi:hypothetical protein
MMRRSPWTACETDSKEKAIAWLAEIEADRAAGKTAADTLARSTFT